MGAHERLRPRAMTGLDRPEQLLVLGDVGVLPGRLGASAREEPASDVRDPERVEDAPQGVVLRRGGKRGVEAAARVVGSCRRAGRALGDHPTPQLVQVGVVPPLGGKPRNAGLEQEPRLETLEHALEADVRDEEAAIDLEVDETVAREAAQRLPHRAAGDTESVRELRLTDARPGLEPSVDDPCAELVVGQLDDGANAEWAGRSPHHWITGRLTFDVRTLYTHAVPGARGAGKQEELQ